MPRLDRNVAGGRVRRNPLDRAFVALRAPVFALFGIPLEIIAVFLVVETIPDMFKTLCNVTGDVVAVAWVDRGLPKT